jgi:hypothetical protein
LESDQPLEGLKAVRILASVKDVEFVGILYSDHEAVLEILAGGVGVECWGGRTPLWRVVKEPGTQVLALEVGVYGGPRGRVGVSVLVLDG